jgi:hypothetical protein
LPCHNTGTTDLDNQHTAAKAAAEAAAAKDNAPQYSYVLKTMSSECLQLQCSKPALCESHLRFVPLTPGPIKPPEQINWCIRGPRQGMILMHALRSGKPKNVPAPTKEQPDDDDNNNNNNKTPLLPGRKKRNGSQAGSESQIGVPETDESTTTSRVQDTHALEKGGDLGGSGPRSSGFETMMRVRFCQARCSTSAKPCYY